MFLANIITRLIDTSPHREKNPFFPSHTPYQTPSQEKTMVLGSPGDLFLGQIPGISLREAFPEPKIPENYLPQSFEEREGGLVAFNSPANHCGGVS
jgi:hypothetical protein